MSSPLMRSISGCPTWTWRSLAPCLAAEMSSCSMRGGPESTAGFAATEGSELCGRRDSPSSCSPVATTAAGETGSAVGDSDCSEGCLRVGKGGGFGRALPGEAGGSNCSVCQPCGPIQVLFSAGTGGGPAPLLPSPFVCFRSKTFSSNTALYRLRPRDDRFHSGYRETSLFIYIIESKG